MIEFFEMLNDCSGLRTTAYLLFVLALTYIIFVGIIDIIVVLVRGNKKSTNNDDSTDVWNWKSTEDRNE